MFCFKVYWFFFGGGGGSELLHEDYFTASQVYTPFFIFFCMDNARNTELLHR